MHRLLDITWIYSVCDSHCLACHVHTHNVSKTSFYESRSKHRAREKEKEKATRY
jgi:hypothetical protein